MPINNNEAEKTSMTEHNEQNNLKNDNLPYQEISDPAVLTKNPIVSVKMITYNHEPYIAQAIEGVVRQETEFPFELIIGEDCSTDGTMAIVLEYQKKYPEIIRVVTSNKNVGAKKNGYRTTKACRGKYIAFCEGDDYWTDPLKLQKQVDFLEVNHDYGLVYTDFTTIDENNNEIYDPFYVTWQKPRFFSGDTFWELLKRNFIPTLTVVVRNKLIQLLAGDVANKWFVMDCWYWLNIAYNSKTKYFNFKTAKYRRHNRGLTYSGFIEKRKPYLEFDILKKYILYNNGLKLAKKDKLILAEKCVYLITKSFVKRKEKIKLIKLYLKNNPGVKKTIFLLYRKCASRASIEFHKLFSNSI